MQRTTAGGHTIRINCIALVFRRLAGCVRHCEQEQPEREAFDWTIAFSSEIASSFRSAIERAGMQLRVGVQPLEQHVYVDRDMWEKILLNLLSNAFKFTFSGEIAVTVGGVDDSEANAARSSIARPKIVLWPALLD